MATANARRQHYRTVRGAAIVATGLLIGLAGFQAALAAGVPWGKAAWGGRRADLSGGLRVLSGAVAVLAGASALVILRRAGHQVWAPLPLRWLAGATWALAAYMALGTLLNAISRSPIERAVWTPTALSLAVLCGLVAKWGPEAPAQPGNEAGMR